MREIPEALRLAYALKERHGANSFEDDAATELRRQHAEIERLKADNDALRRELEEIEQNAVISLEMQEWP
jgi:cell division protein FtsB